jgi:CBS domain containing-hemolysin-like protein
MNQQTVLLLLFISLVLCAFFAATEMAFVSSNKFKVELDKNKANFTGKLLGIVTRSPSKFIGTMLVGNCVGLVVFGVMAEQLLNPYVFELYTTWFTKPPEVIVIITQTIISTIFILITAEFLPKVISSLNPNRFLNFFVLPTTFFYYLFQLPVYLVVYVSKIILSIFKVKMKEEEVTFEKTDLNYYLDQVTNSSNNAKVEVENEVKILQNVLEFPSVRARDCMVPRTEIVAIDVNATIPELKKLLVESGHSKILVYNETIDDVIGFVDSFQMFKNPADLKSLIMPIIYVPETMFVQDILTQFSQQRRSISVVVDEYGGTAGLLTMEDIIEQIFGEIDDELDVVDQVKRKISDHEYVFSARLEIDQINDEFKLDLPESEEYTTLAGMILFYNQDLPKEDDEIEIKQFKFLINRVSETRIEEVTLYILRD